MFENRFGVQFGTILVWNWSGLFFEVFLVHVGRLEVWISENSKVTKTFSKQSRSRTEASSFIGMLFDIGNGNQSIIVSKSSLYVHNCPKSVENRIQIDPKWAPNGRQIGPKSASAEVSEHGPREKKH